MKAASYLVLLLAAACAEHPWYAQVGDTPVSFISPCGLKVYNTDDLKGQMKAEHDALVAFEKAGFMLMPEACFRLSGVGLYVVNPGVYGPGPFYSEYHEEVVRGYADCPLGMVIGSDFWRENAFGHEVLHILEGCNGHERWKERGLEDAIGDAKYNP